MSPDDPRHGTYAGANAHWIVRERPCDRCQWAATRYAKERQYDNLRGRPRSVSPVGVARRVQALQCMGWSLSHIAQRLGTSRSHVHRLTRQTRVSVEQAARVAAVYEQMCMELGPSTRSRNDAARRGWQPPLAWDDIDNPDERPRADRNRELYSSAEMTAEWEHLRRCGESIQQAAKSLGVTVSAIEKAVERTRKVVA